MKPYKGMYIDCAEVNQPEGTYRYAKNMIKDNNALENESGFKSFGQLVPVGYNTIGMIPVEGDMVIFSTTGAQSEIGLASKVGTGISVTYTTIYNNSGLNFNINKPITGKYRRDINGDRIIVWTDNYNVPRILNIDDLSGINDVNDLAVWPDITNPSLTTSSISDSGGSLPVGAIIPITRYEHADGSQTNWFVHDHVLYINDDSKTGSFHTVDGAAPGTITNKSVSFTLSSLDPRFDTVVVGYIRISESVITVYETSSYTNSGTINCTITGSESSTELAIDEVLVGQINFKTAKTLATLQGRLFWGNLTAEAMPELQEAACNIQLNYEHSLVSVLSTSNNHKDNLPPSLMPGEVYAFYLAVELLQGGWAYYHIPGRPAVGTNKDSVTADGMSYTKYQVEDTADSGGALTNMGYWENPAELYPNTTEFSNANGSDLRNQPVRHHRMPTLNHLVQTYYTGNGSVGITHLPRLYVTASNVVIPGPIQAKIKRWKIMYAKKATSDSLVIGSDLLQFGVPTELESTVRWGTGGNWSIEAQQAGADVWRDFTNPVNDTLRGHCLDFLYDKGEGVPTYAWFVYKLRRSSLNTQYTGFGSAGARLTVTGDNRGLVASAIIDYTVPSQTVRSGTGFRKRLDNFKYLPHNALDGKFKTVYTEGAFVADIYSPGASFSGLTFDQLRTNSAGQSPDDSQFASGFEDTMYMQYYRLLSNVHQGVFSQDLIPLEGYAIPSVTTLTAYGGDTFLCYMSYLACAPLNSEPDSTVGDSFQYGVRMWKGYIGYSRRNWNYRHQEAGQFPTFYHGKTDVRSLFSPYVTGLVSTIPLFKIDAGTNEVSYNQDFNRLNEFIVGKIWSPDLLQQTSFPHTLIFSPQQDEEDTSYSWRGYLAGDRYTIPQTRGDIVNLEALDNKMLLIHTEYTLYRTRTDVKQAVENEEVFFKSANLFDLPPEEILSVEEGFAGTQNQFACIVTPHGYFFVSEKQGSVFLYDGQTLQEISSNGYSSFFRDYTSFQGTNYDNPFTQEGFTAGYDSRLNRLILSRKSSPGAWTLSYDPVDKLWISSHSYTPDYMVIDIDGILWATYGDEVYWINTPYIPNEVAQGVFFGSTVNPSIVDVVLAPEPSRDKLVKSINWLTEAYVNFFDNNYERSLELVYFETFTHITVRSLDHCTGRLPLVRWTEPDDLYNSNLRVVNRTWYFHDVRDIVQDPGFLLGFLSGYALDNSKLNTNMEWYDQRRFVDKFIICRLEYSNTANRRLLLLDVNMEYDYPSK